MLEANQMLFKCFYDRRLIHFYDSLNIVLILNPGCEFFGAKCVKFPLMINFIKE